MWICHGLQEFFTILAKRAAQFLRKPRVLRNTSEVPAMQRDIHPGISSGRGIVHRIFDGAPLQNIILGLFSSTYAGIESRGLSHVAVHYSSDSASLDLSPAPSSPSEKEFARGRASALTK
ncbi:hypothetical protein NDN08_007296 [Rhodosorus marinus]|uniref:Uncharacterized protein n=1 Tax=Rhodosorus marinus TaxID=101924 RepID=A0AAV8UG36_9RHOD|nr:hypothetical protein NDN08_007296 [Rhodosorus marinus]